MKNILFTLEYERMKFSLNYGFLNLASLLMGLAAWGVPIFCIVRHKYSAVFSIASFAFCGLALIMQMMYQRHLVNIEDWAALMDTSGAVVIVSVFLLVTTTALNCFVAMRNRSKLNAKRKEQSS